MKKNNKNILALSCLIIFLNTTDSIFTQITHHMQEEEVNKTIKNAENLIHGSNYEQINSGLQLLMNIPLTKNPKNIKAVSDAAYRLTQYIQSIDRNFYSNRSAQKIEESIITLFSKLLDQKDIATITKAAHELLINPSTTNLGEQLFTQLKNSPIIENQSLEVATHLVKNLVKTRDRIIMEQEERKRAVEFFIPLLHKGQGLLETVQAAQELFVNRGKNPNLGAGISFLNKIKYEVTIHNEEIIDNVINEVRNKLDHLGNATNKILSFLIVEEDVISELFTKLLKKGQGVVEAIEAAKTLAYRDHSLGIRLLNAVNEMQLSKRQLYIEETIKATESLVGWVEFIYNLDLNSYTDWDPITYGGFAGKTVVALFTKLLDKGQGIKEATQTVMKYSNSNHNEVKKLGSTIKQQLESAITATSTNNDNDTQNEATVYYGW